MENQTVDKALEKLRNDENFQKALQKYQEAEEKSSEKASEISLEIIKHFALQDMDQTIEEARFGLIVARMTASKILATLSSFNYEEKDFMESIDRARKCVQEELVPMLMDVKPCGECEECKNGHRENCLNPEVRKSYCESRFLPLLCDCLIEYDAWSEILYNAIPQDARDIDLLKDINDETESIKRQGRPAKID